MRLGVDFSKIFLNYFYNELCKSIGNDRNQNLIKTSQYE